ncbi:MAG: VIT domain-containing protein [bacterium]|nr:VIT domain-containing protein [bacterium]
MRATRLFLAWIVSVAVLLPMTAFSAGMLIPKDESLPPLGIEYLRVKAEVTEGAAETHVEQAFRNTTDRALEATYVFPLPKGAAIKEFAMYIGGKRMTAELLDAGKAKQIYQDIVRRAKDPALLEYMGGQIFRVSVFPVPPKDLQKIELDYSQAIEFDSGLRRYVFPMRIGEQFSKTLQDFSVTARISSKVPIGNIYSPSHVISISRKGDTEATIGFEEERMALDRDFVVYYALSEKEFGLSLMARRTGKDGYFMLMISPKNVVEESQIVKKDVSFVMDTSGSMSGDKIKQTKAALLFCLNNLNKGDRFNIVRFATDVNPFRENLVEVNDESIAAAKEFVEKMEARGGTDIGSALEKALSVEMKEDRPYLIVFLTDGKPTVGMTDENQIIKSVAQKNKGRVRLFAFGVDYNINTRLLDTLAAENKGVAEYVEPKEDIEIKVSSFFAKASHPVLASPELSFGDKVHTYEIYPKELPDLFKGSQVLVLGKYDGTGDVAVTLTGKVNEDKRSFVYETTFPERNEGNDFIERLWATRKVGYLLEEIRLHGEEKELKDEVLRLSKEYGIPTPYTSYLIVEDERPGVGRRGAVPGVSTDLSAIPPGSTESLSGTGRVAGPRYDRASHTAVRESRATEVYDAWTRRPAVRWESGGVPAPTEEKEAAEKFVPILGVAGGDAADEEGRLKEVTRAADALAVGKEGAKFDRGYGYAVEGLAEDLKSIDGDVGVLMSKTVGRMKDAKVETWGSAALPLKNINKRNFYRIRGVWVDSEFTEKMQTINVQFGSDAYFKLLELKPELKDILTLGERLVVTVDGKAIFIAEDVKEPISSDDLEKAFTKA